MQKQFKIGKRPNTKTMYTLVVCIMLSIAAGFTIFYLESRKLRKSIHNVINEVSNNKAELSGLISKAVEDATYNSWKLWHYQKEPSKIPEELRVAHAGGAYNGKTYTNSLDALEANKSRYKLFEIDLIFTADKKLVCAHDWEWYPQTVFNKKLEQVPTYAEFLELVEQNNDFKNCTLDSLIQWLDKTPHARIVTDTKTDGISALEHIAKEYPEHINRFIPQIYITSEYNEVSQLGFNDIILTVYSWYERDNHLVESTHGKKLFAVTLPSQRAPYLAKKLKNAGHRVYAHTVNTQETFDLLRHYGVDEIYTDTLAPAL